MPDTPRCACKRLSAAQVNRRIRRLLERAGGRLTTAEQRAEYERLVVAWAEATRRELVTAA